MRRIMLPAVIAICLGLTGCAMFRVSIKDKEAGETGPLSAKYDQQDLLSWTDEMVQLILNNQFPPPSEGKPILADMGIQNRTKTHLDTQALSDTITAKLLDSGKIRLANTRRRNDLLAEQGYQLQNATPETRAQIGKQLGAQYMLTGSLVEIERKSGRQVRMSRKEDVYYQLTVEITDLQTGLIVLRKQVERMRRASKPIIGW